MQCLPKCVCNVNWHIHIIINSSSIKHSQFPMVKWNHNLTCQQKYVVGCLRVENFGLPIGDINSPHKNKFIEGIVFFQKVTKPLGRPL